ncbi:MAG: ArsA-related P-loop ATPase [Sedimenticola sp.]
MADVHFTMQGKGGVGKTFVASILAQYISTVREHELTVIDTDPVNATLSQYKALNVEYLAIQDADSTRINERHFDRLIEKILNNPESDFVIDNGAATFVPLSNYLIENSAIEMLEESGRKVVIHPVITGGQGLVDTLSGLSQLIDQLPPEVAIVVWKNPFFGDIEKDGKKFEQMAVYKKNQDRIHAVMAIPKQSADTYGVDIEEMLQHKLTFDEAIVSPIFGIMSKQRLRLVKTEIFARVSVALG